MARRFIITHPDGSTLNLVSTQSVSYVSSAQLESQFQGTDSVKLKVKSAVPLDFYIGDTIELWGITYTINQLPKASQDGNRSYEYELTFEGLQYELISRVFILVGLNAMYDSLTGTIDDFMEEIIANMGRDADHEWNWEKYNSEGIGTGETLTESFSDKNCLEVLQQLMTDFECEFKIRQNSDGSRTIIVGSEGELADDSLAGYVFEYGVHGGAYELKREPADNTNIITRLFVYGGSSNLNTLDKVYPYTRLLLPDCTRDTSYLEDKEMQHLYGIKEGIQTFDDIIPTCKGQIAELVSSENGCQEFYAYYNDEEQGEFNIDFDPKDYLIADTTMKITMQTGELAGYSFEVLDDSCTIEGNRIYFHVRQFADENGMKFPSPDSSAFNFRVDDEFLLENIYLPKERIDDAEEKLKEKAQESFDETKMPQIKYSLTIDQQWLKRYFDPDNTGADYSAFECGNLVHVKASPLDIDNSIRINQITRNLLNDYDITLTLADKTTPSIINRIIGAMQTQEEIIKIGDLTNAQKARQNWYTMQEVLNMVFDVEGNYYSEKIAPESIETMMLSVGARSQQFSLVGVYIYPNYGDPVDYNTIYNTGGYLEHYTIDPDAVTTWQIQEQTRDDLQSGVSYYVYARCYKYFTAGIINPDGLIVYRTEALTFEGMYTDDEGNTQYLNDDYYYFLIGTLTAQYDGGNGFERRDFVPTYGSTTINGRFITTGRITANTGNSWFDLDTGEIHGVITFTSEAGTGYDINDVLNIANEAYNDAINAGKGVEEAMEEAEKAYQQAVKAFDEYAYLKEALPDGSQTVVDGGLILSNLICVSKSGFTQETQASDVVAGMAGCDTKEQSEENKGVCFWAGSNYSERTEAPFVVYEDGTVKMTQAFIEATGDKSSWQTENGMILFINKDKEDEKQTSFTSERFDTLREAGLGVSEGEQYTTGYTNISCGGTISGNDSTSGSVFSEQSFTAEASGTLVFPLFAFTIEITARLLYTGTAGDYITITVYPYVQIGNSRTNLTTITATATGTTSASEEQLTVTAKQAYEKMDAVNINAGDTLLWGVAYTVRIASNGSTLSRGYAQATIPTIAFSFTGGNFASKFFSNGIVLQADGNAGFGVLPEATGSSNPQFYMGDTYGNAFRLCNNIFGIRAGSNPTNAWRDATPRLLWCAVFYSGGQTISFKKSFSPLGVDPGTCAWTSNGFYSFNLGIDFGDADDYIAIGSCDQDNGNGAFVSVRSKTTNSFVISTEKADGGSTNAGTINLMVYALNLDI